MNAESTRGLAACAGFCAAFFVIGSGCGKDATSSRYAGMSYCQSRGGHFHFKVFIPPWKHRKEYRCEVGDYRNCSQWAPTGRYVFVVSDSPFVNFDSEIIVSLTIESLQGSGLTHALARIQEIESDASATLLPASPVQDYRTKETDQGATVYDVNWRQKRTFENTIYNWYRRDVYIQVTPSTVYHMEFFSISPLTRPEFDALVDSFATGAAPDGAPRCKCMDEHASPMAECQ